MKKTKSKAKELASKLLEKLEQEDEAKETPPKESHPAPGDIRPPSLFQMFQVVRAPAKVCDTQLVQVRGMEYGPDNVRTLPSKLDRSSWVYTVREYERPDTKGFLVSEAELLKWATEPEKKDGNGSGKATSSGSAVQVPTGQAP